eukprot:scaffold214571_cov21-Tisochrysis_lutea.AAC.1
MWASLLREHVGSQEQRKWHAFHLGVHGQTYHVQMYVPVKVNSQLSRCVRVAKSTLCFSACACPDQDST